jgi:phosphomannomutase
VPTLVLSISGARGIVGDGLDVTTVTKLSGSLCTLLGPGRIVLGRDSRPSGGHLAEAVRSALRGVGRDVVDLGIVTTPTVQVLVEELQAAGGVVISASHNPPEWNALKFVGPDGRFLSPGRAQDLFDLYEKSDVAWVGHEAIGGVLAREDGTHIHIDRILRAFSAEDLEAIRQAGLRVVIDAVHGAGGVLVVPLMERLGVELHPIGCEPDGELPEDPEPRPEAMGELLEQVRGTRSRLGFRLDPDGDRLAVATSAGDVMGEEWTLPLAAWHALQKGKGPLVTNLSTSARLEWVGREHGVPVHRTPVGEAHVVEGILHHRALLGGEGNGGVIDPSVHLGRDAGVGLVHLLALEAKSPGGIAEVAARCPSLFMVKVKVPRPDDYDGVLERLQSAFDEDPETGDGLRWQFADGWVHLRSSGTEPVLRIVAEAATVDRSRELLRSVRQAGGL